jgi:tetratricopeptide (TPR) repeat protein
MYSIDEKKSLIETYFLNNDIDKLEALYFFPKDTLLPIKSIRQWLSTLYNEGEDRLLIYLFYPYYKSEKYVLFTLYRMNQHKLFISSIEQFNTGKNELLDLMTIDAYYKLKNFEAVLRIDSLSKNHRKYSEITKIQLRSAFKMGNYKLVAKLFGALQNSYTQEIIFLAAKAHHHLGNFKIAENLLYEYIRFFEANDLKELQLAYYYQGLNFQEQNKLTYAKQYYKKAIDKNPSYKSLQAFIHQSLANYYESQNNYADAINEWSAYLVLIPETNIKKRRTLISRIEMLKEKAFLLRKKTDKEQKKESQTN